ncbi:hypothetical protein [Haloarcula litorea]|nr:hypothetical protein [Halomicroarcula sp. GDY20]
MDERDYREKRWHRRDGAVEDLDGRVVRGGDFEEWVDEMLSN